ncbi:MAG: Fpg/Nei family DNA glycosylase, partial [Aeromicrobium sp.]
RRPGHSARAVLETDEWQCIGYSLGILEVLDRDDEQSAIGHLGPDLLGPDWDLDEAVRRAGADPDRPVFLALLDQRNLAGFGNEYVNELLFIMGLLPTRPVGDVPDLARVISRGQRMLDVNKARVERSFTGSTRTGEDRWVYRRERGRCRRCGTRIREGQLGDRPTAERNVFWCPHCQT